MSNNVSIAIDGPAGAGKSTIARRLAVKMGYIYVDTGALYRTVAYGILRDKVDYDNIAAVCEYIKGIKVGIKYQGTEQRVFLNMEDVSDFIRTPEVSQVASKTSAIPEVRAFLLDTQRDLAAKTSVVMDGRDIATVVLPNATVKIFLTASAEIRAKRRYDELIEKGQQVDFDDVLAELKERDQRDMTREIAPLKPSKESVIVDTSGLDLDESTAALQRIVLDKINN